MKRAPYQRSRQTRQKLLDAVIQLAREKTYEAITVQDICRRAGVSTGSFYHQFGSKDDLVMATKDMVDALLTEELIDQIQPLPPLQVLDRLLRRYILFIRDEIGPVLAQYYRVLLDHPDVPIQDAERAYCQAVRGTLVRAAQAGLLTSGLSVDELAEMAMRLMRGLFMDWLLRAGDYDLMDRYETEFQLFLRYAC